jgi:hypothetical protein
MSRKQAALTVAPARSTYGDTTREKRGLLKMQPGKVPAGRRMILCAGLQSGGTTLVSWCFLQRHDTNGVLDMPNDVLQITFDAVKEPVLWVKMTIGAFRWLDVAETYSDLGWKPEPLLIVRDVRAAYASLLDKRWGRNGTTGEEPPLRLRFRRFLRDWELFRGNGWPMVRYEDFVQEEEPVLRRLCQTLSLEWDEGMLTWPKRSSDIAYFQQGNETFLQSIHRGSMTAAKRPDKARINISSLPLKEQEWLEDAFGAFNAFHGYPATIERICPTPDTPPAMPPPSFEGTSRHWWVSEYERLWSENEALRAEVQRLRHGESSVPSSHV